MSALQKKHIKSTPPFIVAAAFLALVVAITVGVLAKYIIGIVSAYQQANSTAFYFSTNLPENTAEEPYPVYDGTIDFVVYNNDSLNFTGRNISYQIDVASAAETYTVNIDGAATTSGIIAGNAKNQNSVAIPVTADGDYIVTVSSSSPYAKSITLCFRVNTHYDDTYYTVTPHTDGWLELDLYVGEYGDGITLSYGSLQPDNTIALTSDWKYGTNMSRTLPTLTPNSHYKLIFFGSFDSNNDPFSKSKQAISALGITKQLQRGE